MITYLLYTANTSTVSVARYSTSAIVISFLLFILMLLIIKRNHKVYEERVRIINIIYNHNLEEIKDVRYSSLSFNEALNRSDARYEIFNSISFNEMLYKFWIPVDKFYNENKFSLEVTGDDPRA